MKPTPKEFASRLAPLRNKFSVFATTPSTSSRFPASLVRLKLVYFPHSLAPTLVVLPSMSLGPALHSLWLTHSRRIVVQRLPWLISVSLDAKASAKPHCRNL